MATDNTGALLSANNVTVARGDKQLLSGVSLEVHSGELVGLIGPNGAGKSTLLSVMAGLIPSDGGIVKLLERDLSTYTSRERAREIGWMEQLASAHWPVTVEHLVTLGRLPYLTRWQKMGARDQAIVEQSLASTDCLSLRGRQVTTLSGGELTRVLLARVLASEPRILLADEPIAALDIGHQLQTMDLLRQFADAEQACVVVLHDLSLAARYCDRLYLLHESKLVASGAVASVLSKDNLRQVYGVEVIAGCDEVPWIVPVRRSSS